MFEEDLVTYLKNHAVVGPIVSGDSSDGKFRIYPQMIPQHDRRDSSKQPCIVYDVENKTEGATFCGTDGLINCDLQLETYALTAAKARELGNAIKKALVSFSGFMGSTRISKILPGTWAGLLDPDPGLFGVAQVLSVWYYEE